MSSAQPFRPAVPAHRARSAHATAASQTAPRPVRRPRLLNALLGLTLGAGLLGCGQVGPLYQPPAEPEQKPTDAAEP